MDKKEATPTCITKALHEPVTPYFAAAYTTLMSIVQGVALAMLAYVVYQQGLPNDMNVAVIVTKVTISWLVIGIVWHSYITHIQLGCWRLTVFDTLIPMGFAVLECWVIISVSRSMFQFSLALAVTAIWGFLTFLNSELHSSKSGGQLFEEHFGDKQFANELFSQLRAYHKRALTWMAIVSGIFGIGAAVARITSFSERSKTIVIGLAFVTVILFLFAGLELRSWLNKNPVLKGKLGNQKW
jgi:hypothetical protein